MTDMMNSRTVVVVLGTGTGTRRVASLTNSLSHTELLAYIFPTRTNHGCRHLDRRNSYESSQYRIRVRDNCIPDYPTIETARARSRQRVKYSKVLSSCSVLCTCASLAHILHQNMILPRCEAQSLGSSTLMGKKSTWTCAWRGQLKNASLAVQR